MFEKLEIESSNNELYQEAFTHTSYANEHGTNNYERLEYLGDAVAEWLVMDLIVAMDRNHKISRNTQICNCKKGVIPICPFTVSSKE